MFLTHDMVRAAHHCLQVAAELGVADLLGCWFLLSTIRTSCAYFDIR